MRATRYHLCDFVCVLLTSCLVILLLCCTLSRATGIHQHHHHHHHTGQKMNARHRPLANGQKADQSLQFMLDLYRRAAGPDGRPKQHRKYGSNTVRLLRPSTTIVRSRSAFNDFRYTFSVQYDLQGLPLDRLAKASFVHLRSSTPALPAFPIRARVTSPDLGAPPPLLLPGGLVVLGARERWRETDISSLVFQRRQGSSLALSAHYWYTEPGRERRSAGPLWRVGGRARIRERRGAIMQRHLNPPALLLFLEEEQGAEIRDWQAGAKVAEGAVGRDGEKRKGRLGHPSQQAPPPHRHRRSSKDSDANPPCLKDGENCSSMTELLLSSSSSSSSSSFSSSPGTILSEIPNYKRKNSPVKNHCKIHPYTVSFKDLGLVEFIAPYRYNPNFCKGDCPRVLHNGYNSPNHAMVQTRINEMKVGEVPPPSCVPNHYKPMSVLILEKNKNVVYRELEDMIAENCTCR